MKAFMTEDFLLSTETAKRLYHDYAAEQPIYDYHCHLNPKEIANNRRFNDLGEIWLEDDHYKWRAMRTAGVKEHLITGNASFKEKYQAWSQTVPQCIGNPIYHWTHLELRRPFGIDGVLFSPETADAIWDQCNEMLGQPEFSARGIMQKMNVKMVGTTDDPADSLEHHKFIANDASFDIHVTPSWRPDRAFKVEHAGFVDYLTKLGKAADIEITGFSDLISALARRLDVFDAHGCRSADHGIEIMRFAEIPVEADLDTIMSKRIKNVSLSELEMAQFSTAVQVWLGQQYAKKGWVMQLHIGAQRNNSSRMFKLVGGDSGFDSMDDRAYAAPLAGLLNALDQSNELPKTILYCLNPMHNEMLATMVGNFQGGGVAGKVQFGSGWWFNDQLDGMQRQLTSVAQMGLLSQFVGMLTDSRSFLSYTRHEYFRRLLCDMIGGWVERGEAPADMTLLSNMVKGICADNAKSYFGFQE
ncbi:glucuronate isomerase [Marinomonas piezotolerans]|uniref:Uronate isomerase n=1 Tax=Marinomonas piezotolerans TaxID=2213058 RepID=A0A370U934_9GAMM|nr:glucuronate isomerase [Marinomonas piezotolerans]RDL44284.1 glucuronate isomerase [Marinomonas piezotolerans]